MPKDSQEADDVTTPRRKSERSTAQGIWTHAGIAIITGVNSPLAQSASMMNVLAFSREQEQEADLLGAQLLREASLDPHAAYRVWEGVVAEEKAAAVKRQQAPFFAKTHPDAENRVAVTRDFVTAQFGPPDQELVADDAFLDILNKHYMFLMEDQIDTNRFGRTQELLERHSEMGVNPGVIYFFYGEMFRQRAGEGDAELAMSAYRHSIETGGAPAGAYKNLGYLHLKRKELEEARRYFEKYLEMEPDASDRAMIEFYIAQ